MISTLLQVGKQQKLSELLQHPLYGQDMFISVIISIDKDIVQIYNDEDVKFFSKDLIDISLEAGWRVGFTKRHYLVLKVTVSSPECGFPLVLFADSHLIVDTGEVELSESFCSS